MRMQIHPSRLLFGALLTAALGFGAPAATATASQPAAAPCPGYMSSASARPDCCRSYYGAVGIYNSSLRYCNCAL